MNFLALLCVLLLAPPVLSATLVSEDRLRDMLATIAEGRDKAFGTAVAPATGVDTRVSRADRTAQIVARIARESTAVASAFAAAPGPDSIANAKAAVAAFSLQAARAGVSRSFEGNGPALSVMRQVLFAPAKRDWADPTAQVMDVISQFERSPKTDDTYYEYSDPADLRRSQVTELPGSGASWTTQARSPMVSGKVYALKKCRHVFLSGWYCNTQLYEVRELPGAGGGVKVLLTYLHPLAPGADNSKFNGDRAKNVIDGYTGVYVVAAAGDLVLIYSVGIQSSSGAPGHQGLLKSGLEEEYRQLASRIAAIAGLAKLPY